MIQVIAGKSILVVYLPEIPTRRFKVDSEFKRYAQIMEEAVERGIVTHPGKYAIEIEEADNTWSVYKLIKM